MIVHKIRSKSDPIFLRKVKSADRDLDKIVMLQPLGHKFAQPADIFFSKFCVRD